MQLAPFCTLLLSTVAAFYKGGIEAFRREGGAIAAAGGTVFMLHPCLPKDLSARIRNLAEREGVSLVFLTKGNFAAAEPDTCRFRFTEDLVAYADDNNMGSAMFTADICVVTIDLERLDPEDRTRARDALKSFLAGRPEIRTYRIVSGDTVLAGATETASAAPRIHMSSEPMRPRQVISDDDVVNVRILLGQYGNDVAAFVREI